MIQLYTSDRVLHSIDSLMSSSTSYWSFCTQRLRRLFLDYFLLKPPHQTLTPSPVWSSLWKGCRHLWQSPCTGVLQFSVVTCDVYTDDKGEVKEWVKESVNPDSPSTSLLPKQGMETEKIWSPILLILNCKIQGLIISHSTPFFTDDIPLCKRTFPFPLSELFTRFKNRRTRHEEHPTE